MAKEGDVIPAPEKEKKLPQAVATRAVVTREVIFSGPLPPPAILRQYESILPVSAERIFKMAEQQHNHRMHLEKEVIGGDVKRSNRGLICGTVVMLATLALCAYLGKSPQMVYALALLVAEMGSLLAAFLYVDTKRRKERDDNKKLLERLGQPTQAQESMLENKEE